MSVDLLRKGTPFDAAAGAAGLISLGITVFQGCVQGFIILSTARQLGKDGDLLRCMLEWEHYRLYEWSQQAGLKRQGANPALNWTLAVDLLKQLEAQLNDTTKLRDRYGLVIEENADGDAVADIKEESSLHKLSLRLSPNFYLDSSQAIHEKNSGHPLRRLRWAVIDKARLEGLLQVVRQLIGYLWDILSFDDRRFIRSSLDTLLRNGIASNNNELDLQKVGQLASESDVTIAVAGVLKQSRLELDRDGKPVMPPNRKGVRAQKIKALKLKSGLLDHSAGSLGADQEIGTYDGQHVVIEIKRIDADSSTAQDKVSFRIENLATLLDETVYPSFHSLRCIGFVKESDAYKLVFALPSVPEPSGTEPHLQECITLPRLRSLYRPDLNTRLLWALNLAETVLQLHTAGWLHKGIRPDNIVFLFPEGVDKLEGHQLAGDGKRALDHLHITKPYLAGYEYAREDFPTAFSENVVVPSCYRYTFAQSEAQVSFRADFDTYALGLVLIELVMWTELSAFLDIHPAEAIPKQLLETRILADVHSKLSFSLPRSFADAILLCLEGENSRIVSFKEDVEMTILQANDGTVDTQQHVVSKLRECLREPQPGIFDRKAQLTRRILGDHGLNRAGIGAKY